MTTTIFLQNQLKKNISIYKAYPHLSQKS